MKNFFEFKWKFYLQAIASGLNLSKEAERFLFVSQVGTENWILGAKARRLSNHFNGESRVLFSSRFKKLPKASGYFFLHQKYFAKALRYNPFLRSRKCFVMFTHPEWNKFYSKSHAVYTLKKAYKVICLNQNMAEQLIAMGIDKTKIEVFHMASNPDFFTPVPNPGNRNQTVGFCCAYYKRKNPGLIISLVKELPGINFLLIGQDWHQYPEFNELLALPNFRYIEKADYEDYPALYREMDVFCSPSFLEGGPVPLLEAMLTNVVPVASATGFCPDIIQHGINGFLFNPEKDSLETVKAYILKAFEIKKNIREDVIHFSWKTYGQKISDLYHAG